MIHIPTVAAIYEAFGRGDVSAILDRFSDDVSWEDRSADHGVPWLTPGRGKQHVAGFFQALGSGLEITQFTPVQMLEGGNLVAAIIDTAASSKSTGKSWTEREVHLWEFGPDGKVTSFAHKCDTLAHATAAGAISRS